MAACKNVGAASVNRHDLVDRFPARVGMIFPNADPPPGARVDDAVAISPGACRSERHRLSRARVEPVQAPIGVVRKVRDSASDCPGPAAVLVDAGADIERRRGQVAPGAPVAGRSAIDPEPRDCCLEFLDPRVRDLDSAEVQFPQASGLLQFLEPFTRDGGVAKV